MANVENFAPGKSVRAQDPAARNDRAAGVQGDPLPVASRRFPLASKERHTWALDGRVAIITGAGRGLGREHALLFASEGAKVVVNDLGGDMHGEGGDRAPAAQVVDEIKAMGGEAVANGDNVTDCEGAKRLVDQAIETFGDLHVLVNNAGHPPRPRARQHDRSRVGRGHRRAPQGPLLPDPARRRLLARADQGGQGGQGVDHPHVVDLGSARQPGQTNYGAAKAGIATFSQICAMELGRYGVRSNAIAPMARTRLTEETPGLEDVVKAPDDPSKFDVVGPGQRLADVAYLATADCPFTGEMFFVQGDVVCRYQPYVIAERITNNGQRWTVERLVEEGPKLSAAGERRGGPTELGRASGS